MANTLPTTIEYFDNLLGEQLTEGGGGGGDYTTAKVTIINNSGQDFVAACPIIIFDNRMIVTIDSADMSADLPFDVVLYKGAGGLDLPGDISATMTATGNITISGSRKNAIIRGTGTITIS